MRCDATSAWKITLLLWYKINIYFLIFCSKVYPVFSKHIYFISYPLSRSSESLPLGVEFDPTLIKLFLEPKNENKNKKCCLVILDKSASLWCCVVVCVFKRKIRIVLFHFAWFTSSRNNQLPPSILPRRRGFGLFFVREKWKNN